MSSEDQKFLHSKRIHQKEVSVKKQVHIAEQFGLDVKTPHKYAKHHALNCGNPKCIMCANPRKTFEELTIQEQRMFQDKLQDSYTPNPEKMLDTNP
jgi:hypothetical protein